MIKPAPVARNEQRRLTGQEIQNYSLSIKAHRRLCSKLLSRSIRLDALTNKRAEN